MSVIKSFLRPIVNGALDGIGRFQRFSFPEKYIWQWKRDFLFGRYEKDTVALYKKVVQPGMVVIDVGAHIGYYTRIFSKCVGKNGVVYAFEADPENFELLEKNTKHLLNVRRYPTAIADRVGTIDFYHCEEKTGCHSMIADIPGKFSMRKIRVPSTDLDSFLKKENVKNTDFIKMDIEGGEPIALRGMRDTLTKNHSIQIVSEFAPAWLFAGGTDPDQFLRTIASFGFKISAILQNGLEDFYDSHIPWTNNQSPEYFINIFCSRSAPPHFLK